MQKYVKKEKRYRLINFICLLAVYKKLIGTGRVLGTRILRYEDLTFTPTVIFASFFFFFFLFFFFFFCVNNLLWCI